MFKSEQIESKLSRTSTRRFCTSKEGKGTSILANVFGVTSITFVPCASFFFCLKKAFEEK